MRRMKTITLTGDRDESRDVILAFINDEEEVERPANNRIAINIASVLTTSVHSHVIARVALLDITTRSEIDFSLFDSSMNSERAGTFLFLMIF